MELLMFSHGAELRSQDAITEDVFNQRNKGPLLKRIKLIPFLVKKVNISLAAKCRAKLQPTHASAVRQLHARRNRLSWPWRVINLNMTVSADHAFQKKTGSRVAGSCWKGARAHWPRDAWWM